MFRKFYVPLVCAVTLLLFTVSPVSAAPSLSLGSVASYNVAGKIQASQNCTAIPTNYTLQACYGITPLSPPPPPPPPTITVWIEDNGICQTYEQLCQFSPAVINAPEGSTIVWKNNGTLVHTVNSNVTGAVFDSGSIAPGGNFSYTFKFGGTYQYNDHAYGWMKGTIDIPLILHIPEPPSSTQVVFIPSTPMQVELSGTVGWTVEGLSGSTANLLVSHNLGISIPVPQLPLVTITPVTESGNLVQSIDLATRVESAGTATDLVEHILDGFAAASSSSQGFNSGFGNIISQMSATATSDPSYTLWWVNGPLSEGSPVQVMDGWASVTGSETLNLVDQGNVQAWIVTSQFSQGVNLTVPSSPFAGPGPNSHAALNLNFLWSYDKSSDLLVRSLANGTITMHSTSSTQVLTNGFCPNYPCAYTTVQVNRDMRLTLTLALHLTSTSLSLDQRMRNGSSTIDVSSILASMFATPWSALGFIGVVATAIIAFSLWLSRRVRKSAMPEATPATAPGPPTPPSSAPSVSP